MIASSVPDLHFQLRSPSGMTLTFCVGISAVWLMCGGAFAGELFYADVRSIVQCNGDNAATKLQNFVVNRVEGNNFVMNGTLIIKEDIPGEINITCTAERCMSEDKPDSCEYHTSYKLKNFCEEIGNPIKTWSRFLDTAGIEKQCPLKKGEYHVDGYRMDLQVLQPLALSRPYRVFWKMTIRLDAPNLPGFFCMRQVCSLEPKNKLKRKRKP